MTGPGPRFSRGEHEGGPVSDDDGLEKTDLFRDGITPNRIERVTRILRNLLLAPGRSVAPEIVATHWNPESTNVIHEGWMLQRVIFEESSRGPGGIALQDTWGHALYLPTDGRILEVCSSIDMTKESVDTALTSDKMYEHERLMKKAKHPFSASVPEVARLFNYVSVGHALTRFVKDKDILDQARAFAVSGSP